MMNNNLDNDGWKGSITLVSSTSGYIGGTEVVSYISSKHGITGLLRASHAEAKRKGVRLNAVAPFITPSRITSSYSDAWIAKGLPTNKASEVALAIVQMTLKTDRVGKCDMVRKYSTCFVFLVARKESLTCIRRSLGESQGKWKDQ
jgi:NAD(P)-dependent dehydrogenase (short-subunit alcohol dehydrogenase family)